jgi:DNA-binding FadR family transcriptional regulator
MSSARHRRSCAPMAFCALATVQPPAAGTVIRPDSEALQSGHGLAPLFELRSILETEAVPLADPSITEDDLTILRQAIDRMTGDERQIERNIEPDIAFHSQIAKAMGNEYIRTFIA